jgi:glucosamine--fructose-6-phosphate aminotransferase (isomerizing)
VGRGFSCPTAFEAALKIMETSYLPTLAFSAADLLHGPAAILNPDIPVIAVIGNDATTQSMHTVVGTIAQHGSPVTVIGATAPATAPAHVAVAAAADPALDPILQILPLQALAHDISLGRGLDPDAPRSLNKVTLTL